MTADGSRLCYERPESQNGPIQVYVWDAASKTSTLVSVNLDGTTSFGGASRNSVMNRTGTHVAFTGTETNLVANATNGAAQVYVRDLITGTTLLVSSTTEGSAGEADAQSPALSEDGSVIAFVAGSDGAYLAGDTNGFPDVFVRNLATSVTQIVSAVAAAPPGLILTISIASNAQVRVTWPIDAGKNYRVQYTLNLRDSWSDLAANPTMANGIASILIAPGPTSQSFYRVVVTP
jgi:Tol biopolymer transport system component